MTGLTSRAPAGYNSLSNLVEELPCTQPQLAT